MQIDKENPFVNNDESLHVFRENVFEGPESHIIVHQNTQNSNYSTHWHTPMEIIMPIENFYTAFVNNSEILLRPGDILLIFPNIYHSYVAPPTGMRYFYLIDLSVLKDIRGFYQLAEFFSPSILLTPEDYPDIHTQIKDLLLEILQVYNHRRTLLLPPSHSVQEKSGQLDLTETIIYTKLGELFLLLVQHYPSRITRNAEVFAKNKKQEYLNRFTMICNFIDRHCNENLTLDGVSEFANFSKFHFSRLFKEFTGEPFYHYVNRKRIEYACDLLANQNSTITEIALASGYSSNSIFIRMFKQFEGCTPKEYRKKHQRES